MTYTPNEADAFAVYMIAVAYVDDIPLHAFAPHHLMNVKQLMIKGEYYIWEKEELDVHGRYNPPLAVCSYDEASATWRVELNSGHLVVLHDAGDVWELVKVQVNRRIAERSRR